MSTKIYTAWRIEQAYLEPLMKRYVEIITPLVDKHVFWLANVARKQLQQNGSVASPHCIFDKARELAKEGKDDPCWNPLDATAYVGIWLYKGHAYIRPFGGHHGWDWEKTLSTRRVKIPTYEFFGYWNCSDPPSNVSYKKFEERGRIWHDMDDNHKSLPCLEQHFFHPDGWYRTHAMWPWVSHIRNGERIFKWAPRQYRRWLKEQAASYIEWDDSQKQQTEGELNAATAD